MLFRLLFILISSILFTFKKINFFCTKVVFFFSFLFFFFCFGTKFRLYGAIEAERRLGFALSVVRSSDSPSLCLSVCHTFGLLKHLSCLRDSVCLFGICALYDKTFPMVP